MKNICICFQIHQPLRFRRYRFFDIGNDHYYYDDYTNESELRKIADRSYLPANELLLKLIEQSKSKLKIAFSISGIALDQFQLYAPEVIDSFKQLADTGQVEFLAETYTHSLVSLNNPEEFKSQVLRHSNAIESLFGVKPTAFHNTEMIYSDQIGEIISSLGFKVMLTEGAKHVLGWKSPNYLYCNPANPRLKVLLRNFQLSDDIGLRFGNKSWGEWPLTSEKYLSWLDRIDPRDEVVNLFLNYDAIGGYQSKSSGIFEFVDALFKKLIKSKNYTFATPSEIATVLQPVSAIHVPNPISQADEERDLTPWLGNEMQTEAYTKLYALLPKINKCEDNRLQKDWRYLQVSNHFYYMSTKYFSDGNRAFVNPYSSPYEAFINYMNILSDFSLRLNASVPENNTEVELANLSSLIDQKDDKILKLENELRKLRSRRTTSRKKESI